METNDFEARRVLRDGPSRRLAGDHAEHPRRWSPVLLWWSSTCCAICSAPYQSEGASGQVGISLVLSSIRDGSNTDAFQDFGRARLADGGGDGVLRGSRLCNRESASAAAWHFTELAMNAVESGWCWDCHAWVSSWTRSPDWGNELQQRFVSPIRMMTNGPWAVLTAIVKGRPSMPRPSDSRMRL